jgi:hypothetical protein
MPFREWPIPLHYRSEKVAEVWRVPYQERAFEAERWARERVIRPSVVPGVIDYTEQANAAFRRFAEAGMHIVRSTDSLSGWPGISG